VTDEPADLVNEWIAMAKPKYPIATLRGGLESFLQVKGFPTCAVIDPEGIVRYAGYTGMEEGALGDALGATKKQPLWPKSLSKAVKLMGGDPAKAYAELKKMQAAGDLAEEDLPRLQDFVAYLEGRAADALTKARGEREKGFFFRALDAVEAYAGAEPPFPATADCAKLREELQALPDIKKELAGGEAYEKALVLEKDKDYLEAFNAYKSAAKKYAGTKIGENARARAEEIRTDGLPGYVSACDSCRSGKRACEKHKEDVKL